MLRFFCLAHEIVVNGGSTVWRFENLLNLRMSQYWTTSRLACLVDFDLNFFIQIDFFFVGVVARWSVLCLILLVTLADLNLGLVNLTSAGVVPDELVPLDGVAWIGDPLHSTHLRVVSALATKFGNWNASWGQTYSLLAVVFRSLFLDQVIWKHACWPIDSWLHRCFFPVLPLSWLF